MAGTFDRHTFLRALDELRFDEAEDLLRSAEEDQIGEAVDEMQTRREAAERGAQERYQRIIDLSQARAYSRLAAIREDPSTERLLALLPDPTRKRAELYLRELDRWEASRRETASRRLEGARKALGGLDLDLARGLLARVDGRFLDEPQRAERDQLLLEVSARAVEMQDLEADGRRLVEESRRKPRRWWNRRG